MFCGMSRATPSHWMSDGSSSSCSGCGAPFASPVGTAFGLGVARHHCRRCGCLACESCASRRMPVLADSEESSVRVCDACADALEVENVCHSHHFPVLAEGMYFTKQGLIKSRSVFMYLGACRSAVFYRPADPSESGEIKSIAFSGVKTVTESAPPSLTVRVVCRDRTHIIDAESMVHKRLFAESMRMLVKYHRLKPLERIADARRANMATPRDEALNHRRVEAQLMQSKRQGEKKMRTGRAVQKNKARRRTLREKYNLNTMPR